MGKFVMPNVKQFLRKKRLYSKKQDLEWEYLELEMLNNLDRKPYNNKVHDWLQYLRELRHYRHAEHMKQKRRLCREAGPPWFVELSSQQKEVLNKLKSYIHQDILENIPRRVRKALFDLGTTLKVPNNILLMTMSDCAEDAGLFIWNLYKAIYHMPPSELSYKYDMNAMVLMSSLVFIDLDECIQQLEKLTHFRKVPVKKVEKKEPLYTQPNVQYGHYLQTMRAACYLPHKEIKKPEPLPLGNKLRLRSEQSYENLIKDERFLQKRRDRNIHEKEKERICTYKFWEAPSTLRNTDPKMVAYVNKLRMFKLKAKPKFKAPYENIQYLVGNVVYTGEKPHYLISNVSTLPTGYIHINGGQVMVNGTAVTTILGFWKYPIPVIEKCDTTCDCLAKWESRIMKYVNETKCKCGHLYDFYNEGKPKEKYFYPSNKHGQFWIDRPKIFQMDPMEDFIKETFAEGLRSNSLGTPTPEPSYSAAGLKESELLSAFLADLSDTALLIPHLPKANLLNNLQEWVRKRVKGALTPKEEKRMNLQSLRRWLNLKHFDHRARAYSIPFSQKQLAHFKWSQRHMVQKLFLILLEDFVSRNRLKQMEQTRLWWSTTKFDCYPSKAMLDIFFTYFPGRPQDTYFINPYSSDLTPKYGAKTCHLTW